MPNDDLMSVLPLELQLYIADAVSDRCDRAALALASPRLLGLAACRELPSYQGLEMSLAFHRVLGGAIDEQLLRTYASRSEATPEGCKWLAGVAAAAGLRTTLRVAVVNTEQKWYILQPGSSVGALVVRRFANTVDYEGELHTAHYEGEQGEERMVRFETFGVEGVWHFGGEKGAERLLRCERPSGNVMHYEGERGAEHVVRCELPCGKMLPVVGERGAERLVPRNELRSWCRWRGCLGGRSQVEG